MFRYRLYFLRAKTRAVLGPIKYFRTARHLSNSITNSLKLNHPDHYTYAYGICIQRAYGNVDRLEWRTLDTEHMFYTLSEQAILAVERLSYMPWKD